MSALGGFLVLASVLLFVFILATPRRPGVAPAPFTFSVAVRAAAKVPLALNGFGVWLALMVALTLVNYGVPIFQLASLRQASVPAVPIGAE
jgi:cytochrome c oxidase subunit 1